MADEKSVPVADEGQLSTKNDLAKQEELHTSEPPPYESLQLFGTSSTAPYPGLDTELPNYCEVAREVVTGVVIDQPRRYSQSSREQRSSNRVRVYLPYMLLIGFAIISVLLCFPIGLCALGYSISALQHKRIYKERSIHVRTAIGCIMLATAVGVPIHIVFWKHEL